MSNIILLNEENNYIPQTNNAIFPIDQQIFACEFVGSINNQSSSMGNRQAERVGLDAFLRAKVRTCLGQRAKKNPWVHIGEARSGYGQIYGWESNFDPHILEVILSEGFENWFDGLADYGGFSYGDSLSSYQVKPYKTEVMSFLGHVLGNIAQSRLPFDKRQSMVEKIDLIVSNPDLLTPKEFTMRVHKLISIANELVVLTPSKVGV